MIGKKLYIKHVPQIKTSSDHTDLLIVPIYIHWKFYWLLKMSGETTGDGEKDITTGTTTCQNADPNNMNEFRIYA